MDLDGAKRDGLVHLYFQGQESQLWTGSWESTFLLQLGDIALSLTFCNFVNLIEVLFAFLINQ